MSDAGTMPPAIAATADSKAEFFAGLIAIVFWFALFTAGAFIGTQDDLAILRGEAGVGEKFQALIVVLFCYTATNVAMLCCVASVLGGIFRRMRARQRQRLLFPSLLVLLLSLVFQGLVVYLVMASGILSFGGQEHFFNQTNSEKYMRLAATSSLISLMIGYSPGLFNSLMGRLEKWAQQGVAFRDKALPALPSPDVEEVPATGSR